MLSHTDNDHAGGVPAVRQLLQVRRELGTAQALPCRDGMKWQWDGVRFTILHPDGSGWSDNNGSCVLKIDGPFSVLLPGDIERQRSEEHTSELQSLMSRSYAVFGLKKK